MSSNDDKFKKSQLDCGMRQWLCDKQINPNLIKNNARNKLRNKSIFKEKRIYLKSFFKETKTTEV